MSRSLVGSFPDCDEIPTRNDLRNWVQQTWKGIHNIQVFDLNGNQFLFEFQSKRDAENVLSGRWKRNNHHRELDWWTAVTGAIPAQKHFDWFWVRILGLSLHLWSEEVMKKIGDQCGGWIETEEETQLRNHLRWARLRVRGPFEDIPAYVEVSDGDYTFSLLVWCEAPARFRLISSDEHKNRETTTRQLDPRVEERQPDPRVEEIPMVTFQKFTPLVSGECTMGKAAEGL